MKCPPPRCVFNVSPMNREAPFGYSHVGWSVTAIALPSSRETCSRTSTRLGAVHFRALVFLPSIMML